MIPEKPFGELSPDEQAVVRAWFRFRLDIVFFNPKWPYNSSWLPLNLSFAHDDYDTQPIDHDYIYRLRPRDPVLSTDS